MADRIAFHASMPDTVLGVMDSYLPTMFAQLFPYLMQPDIPPMVLYEYVVAIKDKLLGDRRRPGKLGFSPFQKIAIDAHIVKTMLHITKDTRTDMNHVLASHFAIEVLWHLITPGKPDERRALLAQYINHGILDLCLDKARNHPFFIHRYIAVRGLRVLSSEAYLGDYLSAQQMSDVLMAMCQVILSGPELFTQQMASPEMTWQSLLCFGKLGTPQSKASRYAPRYYAIMQENAAWTIHSLLCRAPPPSQQFSYDILNHDPVLIDLLFKCAKTAREPWYPNSEVDSIICEAITLLFHVSVESILGLSIPVGDERIQNERAAELDALIKSIKLLTAQTNWVQKIVDVWQHIDDEKWEKIESLLKRVQRDYHVMEKFRPDKVVEIAHYRGRCRVSIERLIATIAYAAHVNPDNGISDADLLALLLIGHASSQIISEESVALDPNAPFTWLERTSTDAFREPISSKMTLEKAEQALQIPEELVMGPTCLVQLLTALAKRGLLEEIQNWGTLPEGIPLTSLDLGLIKQIMGQGIRRVLTLGVKREADHRKKGYKQAQSEHDFAYAGFSYYAAAELVAAIVNFDRETKGKYAKFARGARRDLIFCLGNAAEMALGLKRYPRALVFATGAVELAKDLPEEESVEKSIIEKNQGRLTRAVTGLGRS